MKKSIIMIAAVGLSAAAFMALSPAFAAMQRTFVTGNTGILINGAWTGFVRKSEGGIIGAQVIKELPRPDGSIGKHVSQPTYEPVSIQIGLTDSKAIADWISLSWKNRNQRQNVSIVQTDANYIAKSTKDFQNCLLTETTIPAMDAGSKEPAYITVKLTPEGIVEKPGGIDVKSVSSLGASTARKVFLPSNFKLEIDGLDCSGVNRIDAFTVKLTTVDNNVGESRDSEKEPGKLEFPNLKITMSDASVDPWKLWFDDFVVKGNNSDKLEKKGSLSLLATDGKTVLARVHLFNIGILRLEPDKATVSADGISRTTVVLYVERMEFELVSEAPR